MLSPYPVRFSMLAGAVLALLPFLATPAVGQDIVEGVITNVDLHGEPRHITVRQRVGGDVDVRIHVSSHINFLDPRDAQVCPQLGNLRAGMQVRAIQGGADPSKQIDIVSIPDNIRALSGGDHLVKRSDRDADKRVANAPPYPPLPAGGAPAATSSAPGKHRNN
jgi:hypothetical protein